MEEQELKNFLRGEGEELTKVSVPTIDVNERCLADIADEIESDGLDHLVQNVGTIANTFKTENDFSCSPEVVEEGLKLIHIALQRLYNGITNLQGNVKGNLSNLDKHTKLKFRKYSAVLYFLIYKSFVEIERAVAADSHNISLMAQQQLGGQKGRRGKKAAVVESDESKYKFWQFWRPRLVSELLKVVVPPMDEIWEISVDGYNFFRCITLALCTTIKNKSKLIREFDREADEIFDILGVLASRHNEEKGITSRLVPLLKESEDAARIVTEGLAKMISQAPEDRQQNMVLGTLNEAWDTYSSRLDKDSVAEKGFHTFLTTFVALHPRGFMHSLAVVVHFLEAESPSVRNAVILVGHELMKWTWQEIEDERNAEQTDEEARDERPNVNNWLQRREKLFNEILLLHTQDMAAVVRSKSIQCLGEIIKQSHCIPAEAHKIMQTVRKRLLDKNNLPRKHAANLISAIVDKFPYVVLGHDAFITKINDKLNLIITAIQDDYANEPSKAIYFIIKEFHLNKKMTGFVINNEIKEKLTDTDAAMALLETLLKEKNYWGACETLYLCMKRWANELDQLMTAIRRHDGDQEEHLFLRFFKFTHADIFPEAVDDLELDEVSYMAPQRVVSARILIEYILCTLKMKEELDLCQPSLRKLLELGTTVDKKEALGFFTSICKAGYKPPRAVTVSIINALAQLTEEELKDFVDNFKSIFIGPHNVGAAGLVKKLLELIDQLSENLVESLSSIIRQLYLTGSLNNESINVLWDAYSLSTGGWEPSASSCAAHLLGIIGQIERKVITSNLNRLIEVGLGPRGIEDYELAKVTLQAILYGCKIDNDNDETDSSGGKAKSKTVKVNKNRQNEDIKLPSTHDLFVRIIELIEHGMREEGNAKLDMMYPRVAELSMQIIYRMCAEPTEVIRQILPHIYGLVFEAHEADSETEVSVFKTSERILFRYMSFGKALLGAHIMFYDQIVSKEIKARKAQKDKASKKNNKVQGRQRARLSTSTTSTVTTSTSMNQSNQEAQAEMDMVMGHIGFDAEQDQIKTYVSNLLDQGFLRQFRVHVFFLCKHFTTIKSLNLKVASVQALAKLALVSENSILSSLDTFISLWEGNEAFAVKLEILKASVRLTVRFPNQMEKMNNVLTSGLADKEVNVRKACMDYIAYLALSDLLKVKEQFHSVAACLCDESFELREMAKDFINQISEKDNVLQNCIPDIMSRLSARDDICQTDFQSIMKYLLQKVKKEKQLGGLVDRIVQRFKGKIPVRTVQDTIFCLNQIQQNDKTLKIMKDNIVHYADKLADALVWDLFMDLLEKFKKLNKADLKPKIEEWEKELEEHHEKCVALDTAEKAAKRKNEKQKITADESSSEEEEENENADENKEDGNAEGGEENGEDGNNGEGGEENGEEDAENDGDVTQPIENEDDEQEGSDKSGDDDDDNDEGESDRVSESEDEGMEED